MYYKGVSIPYFPNYKQVTLERRRESEVMYITELTTYVRIKKGDFWFVVKEQQKTEHVEINAKFSLIKFFIQSAYRIKELYLSDKIKNVNVVDKIDYLQISEEERLLKL